jgi:hypothetical protein
LGEQVERLAEHAFRGELWGKALAYCWQAGMKAFAHSAHREAAAYLEQALQALQHLPEDHEMRTHAIEVRLHLRHALVRFGGWEAQQRVLDLLGEAEQLADALGAHHQRVQITGYLANHLQWIGEYDRALTTG